MPKARSPRRSSSGQRRKWCRWCCRTCGAGSSGRRGAAGPSRRGWPGDAGGVWRGRALPCTCIAHKAPRLPSPFLTYRVKGGDPARCPTTSWKPSEAQSGESKGSQLRNGELPESEAEGPAGRGGSLFLSQLPPRPTRPYSLSLALPSPSAYTPRCPPCSGAPCRPLPAAVARLRLRQPQARRAVAVPSEAGQLFASQHPTASRGGILERTPNSECRQGSDERDRCIGIRERGPFHHGCC